MTKSDRLQNLQVGQRFSVVTNGHNDYPVEGEVVDNNGSILGVRRHDGVRVSISYNHPGFVTRLRVLS